MKRKKGIFEESDVLATSHSHQVQVRFTEEQWQAIRAKATEGRLKVSTYIRLLTLTALDVLS